MPTDIKFYQPFGGEKVVFEKEEVTEMKKFGEPGIWHFEVLPSAHHAYMYACAAPLIGLDCEYVYMYNSQKYNLASSLRV